MQGFSYPSPSWGGWRIVSGANDVTGGGCLNKMIARALPCATPTRPPLRSADPPHKGLRDSHILHSHCKTIAFRPVGKFGPSGSHGLRTGRLVVAIPSAETGNDPGQPGQRAFGMRILLALSLAFECRADRFGGSDEIIVGDIRCRSAASISGVDQLNGARGRYQRDRGELEQARSFLDLRLLQAQPVAFHGAEGLLDAPPQPIQLHDLVGGGELVRLAANRHRGEQTPDDRIVAFGRIDLVDFHQRECHRCWIGRIGSVTWLGDAYPPRLHANARDACEFARPMRRNTTIHRAELAPIGGRGKQQFVVIIGELAILRGTHDQLHARWNTDELLVDVELTIAEHDQLCRAAEPIAGDRPSPAGPSPLRARSRSLKLISVVSCAATIRRPAQADAVRCPAVTRIS